MSLLRTRGQLRFAWSCNDRIEWVFNETQLHLLYAQNCMIFIHQLGPYFHYPRVACGLKEPIPVEGSLVRLTNAGQNNLQDFLLFHQRQPPFFRKPLSAISLLNSDSAIDVKGKVLNLEELTRELKWLPQVYEHCPFPLDDKGHISWLKSDMSMDEVRYDRSTLFAAESR